MTPLERLGHRLQRLRRDALVVEGVLLLAGLGFLISVNLAGDPGWYGVAWALVLLLALVVPEAAHALLPLGVLTWWFSHAPVGSAYSLPAAWSLLGVFTALALLTASPDGMALSQTIASRYAMRTLTTGALTAVVWALALPLRDVRGNHLIATVVGFATLATVLILLPRILRPINADAAVRNPSGEPPEG